ncbi:AarF/UbiB family protein, partial [Halomonas sp. ND22Bw]|uniref:AarF/UbiB family protein n=1 Tax=Halomonas sp. ND22Bw TaxID=2054178 RepID=UPI0034E062DF
MGAAFVKRRMMAELGANWQTRFQSFDLKPAAAASLGQVHRATALDGTRLACKLQYPDMQSAVRPISSSWRSRSPCIAGCRPGSTPARSPRKS